MNREPLLSKKHWGILVIAGAATVLLQALAMWRYPCPLSAPQMLIAFISTSTLFLAAYQVDKPTKVQMGVRTGLVFGCLNLLVDALVGSCESGSDWVNLTPIEAVMAMIKGILFGCAMGFTATRSSSR